MSLLAEHGTRGSPGILDHYCSVRRASVALCEPLAIDDYAIQPMADASSPKWHLAHTTWFFETFLLRPYVANYPIFHPRYEQLFNSYYNGVGEPFPRANRGLLSRPTVAEINAYRAHVDDHMTQLLEHGAATAEPALEMRLNLGIHHERQHQELLLTDVKYNLGNNPLLPAYETLDANAQAVLEAPDVAEPVTFVEFTPGLVEIGTTGAGFAFDNESPRHRVYLQPYALADRLVTNGEYLEFVLAGGYDDPALWLSDGWTWLNTSSRPAVDELRRDAEGERRFPACTPLYWFKEGAHWFEYRLSGPRPLARAAPVCHVSFYEADAYARWAGVRLPLEQEWEAAVSAAGAQMQGGNFVESGYLHPTPRASLDCPLAQVFGDVWEWTASPYVAYPGYQPLPGTIGEYNGKFMSNQLVLRGGSCVSAGDHISLSYRNFFYPPDRWQFTGIRLAKNV